MTGHSDPRGPRPSPELIAAVRTYYGARAAAETLKPVVTKIKANLLDELEIHYDPKWAITDKDGNPKRRITNPDETYLMSEEDSARYFPALDAAYKAAGFNMPDGKCPYLMVHHEQIKAENSMLELSIELHGSKELASQDLYDEIREEAINLILNYVTQFLKPIYQIQVTPLTVDSLDPDAWRDVEADTREEALQAALRGVKESDLPCRVHIVEPLTPKRTNGAPMVVHAYDMRIAPDRDIGYTFGGSALEPVSDT